ncbi:MAG: cytochrome c3 family protein [Desulfovibrio sp.]|jgi:NAD-dependent SIR2 family protein deacetylase|uniref:cytochrome c3 family protein n=1 Tax=uncultured Desulfovibrio sp. TaxID=167968 RepID=UPI001B201E91|nr:cytochrome c3 family protein [uncultured Desulfovibrio sp.]MBE6441819.1 cytochrome C [Desulfovibrio desulfuricans]MBO6171162.1 cytochrome c3 family protein [Desulfovibrio sp.]
MKNILLPLCGLLLATAAFAVAAPSAPQQPLELQGSKKTVMFPHGAHAAIACADCHHLVDGKESFAKCGSAGCHDDIQGRQGVKSLYNVMHSKKELNHATCVGCHAKFVAEHPDRKKELTGCAKSACHP